MLIHRIDMKNMMQLYNVVVTLLSKPPNNSDVNLVDLCVFVLNVIIL